MSCCAVGTNECPDLRRLAFALGGWVSVEGSRCLGSMARRAKDSVAPLRRSSAGWMPARIGRLPVGAGTQASSHNSQGVVDGRVDEVCVITAALGIQVWSYSPTVAMSLLNTPSTDCQSLSACMIAGSSAYACVLETVVGESEMQVLKRRGTKTDPCGTQLIC